MRTREEIEREISHLEKQLDHLEDEKHDLEEKITWYSSIVQMDLDELADLEKQEFSSGCDRCGNDSELNEDLLCINCQPKYNEDEFER